MTIIELEQAARTLGYTLVPQDIHDGLLDVAVEHEELRCDLDRLVTLSVEDALAGMGA